MNKEDIKNLKKRYLIWFYKTLKEEVDKIERKFTQVEIDRVILKELKSMQGAKELSSFIKEFERYVAKKEALGAGLKFKDKKIRPSYAFLIAKLRAVERASIKELGVKGLKEIKLLYEKEMAQRILRSTEH
ncbi:MAG: hypothetical protein WAQ07_04195 [Candidatus Omnitrophota bacterium]